MEHIDEQSATNIWLSVFFAVLALGGVLWLWRHALLPVSIHPFDFVLLALATFRLTRLFVYDSVMAWLRNLFMDVVVVVTELGETTLILEKPASGFRRTMADLLACPWCVAMWSALSVSFVFFLTPLAWFPIFILALAAVASFTQLLANMIGWAAEYLKQKAKNQ